MFESEDSDIEEGPDVVRHKAKIIYQHTFPYIHMEPPDVLYERWARIKLEVREAVGHMMHISLFWWHILFRQQENHTTTAWAVDMGFLDSNVSNDLSLKRLHRIEILELILNTVEKCLADTDPERKARELVLLSTSFKLQEECLAKAVCWLEVSGPTSLSRRLLDLGSKQIRYRILQFIFIEYARYVQVMSCSKKKMIRELSVDPDQWNLLKSEEMKNKGNEQFQKKKYDLAVKWYTKAIKYHTNNHLLYGNRSLCFIRCEKYLKAMNDGKRAIILQKNWAKGHYRFCDALFFLGAKDKAVEANILAQQLCCADPEGLRDLQQQHCRFLNELYEEKVDAKPKKTEPKKAPGKRSEAACGMETSAEEVNPHKEPRLGSCTEENEQKAEDQEEQEGFSDKFGGGPHTEESARASRDAKSEMADRKSKKVHPGTPEKTALRSKHPPATEKLQPNNSGASSKEQFCAAVHDAHTALTDQRCRNAEQAFSLALSILDSSGTKDLGITELDMSLLLYGYATALVEIGQPEDLAKAQRQFDKLSSLGDRRFQSLVHYGYGKFLLKENRFSEALERFSNALLMVQRQITPGKLTWPTTKVTVEETKPEYLKEQLENSIELCKFPPKPDAICRYDHCLGHSTRVYFTDPDFKGFIRITCCESCNVEFHINCWKKHKSASFADKNDKDFLQDFCFTPDCPGKICHFVIFGSTGLIKCKFESSIPKNKAPGRLRVRQACTSPKKLKSKEDRKLKRKQQRVAASVAKSETNSLTREEGRDQREQQTASTMEDYTIYGDSVLHQIYERRELFNDEIHNISTILMCLRPWMELDEANGHVSMLKDCPEPQVLRDLVDLLLKRSNRVWARLFVHNLIDCSTLKPKLHNWALHLDRVGFSAAENFIDKYGNRLEGLDLSPLLTFPPLQNVLIEKFGTMPELFDNTGVTVMDYLRQAPPQEMRLFIWTLEVHREGYPTCFTILDEYFETDGICLVIRKTEIDEHSGSSCKGRSKNRKKKQKELKPVLVLSGGRSGLLRDEEDDFFSEEDSLILLDSTDPFSVPDRLRDQVAEFEGHYTLRLNHYKRVMDNNPDLTKESLYDYFAQILEQNGPLEVSNPLLVGELENFPLEAQQKIEAAGGLEAFLLESLRFVKNENHIGLMKHAVTLQHSMAADAIGFPDCVPPAFSIENLEFREPFYLDPTAREFLPHFDDRNASCDILGILSNENNSASGLSEPTLPDPYVFESQLVHNGDYMFVPKDTSMLASYTSASTSTVSECSEDHLSSQLDFYNSAYTPEISYHFNPCSVKGGVEAHSGIIPNETKKHENKAISVQTFGYNEDTKDDVAVNTEPCALFERNKGDMILKEKNNIKLEKHIQNMKDTRAARQRTQEDELSVLKADVEKIQLTVEITNKELGLFQQKLEEEIRKDQQEKKQNQETLKNLKGEIKELTDLQESYNKQIQDKNAEYDTALQQLVAISNQSAAEKMSLEDEINRRRDVCAKASSRSVAAQLSVLQNRREHGLRKLRKCVSDGKIILQKMTELSARYPSGGLFSTIEAWKSCVQEAENKISRTMAQYEEQFELLKKGAILSSLPPVSIPSAPAPPPLPPFLNTPSHLQQVPQQFPVGHRLPHLPYSANQHPLRPQIHTAVNTPLTQPAERFAHPPPAPSVPATRLEAPQNPAAAAQAQQHLSVFQKIIDHLSLMFPHYSREILSKFIQEVRNAQGSLNHLTYEEVINRVSQLILDHQEESREQINSARRDMAGVRENVVPSPTPSADSSRATSTPPPAHVWKSVSSQQRGTSKALNMEDPCIICHEDMASEDLCVLECRHSFHRECIKSWLKEQSTCPTCREHALLPEDFPMLPGRLRRGRTPTASSS